MTVAAEPRHGARAHLRTLRTAFWLGWKIESSWTDPFLFSLYTIIRPLAGALILVFMFYAVTRRDAGSMLDFLVVGTAFWPFVLSGVRGMVFGHIEDRESFQTLRAVYTAPISYRVFLVGRSLAQIVATAAVSTVITLAVGAIFLDVTYRIDVGSIAYALAAIALGIAAVLALGILATGAAFLISGEAWQLPEGIAAGLYLLSGAIYPVTILPVGLEWIAKALPLSWWLEATRRALAPAAPRSYPEVGDGAVLGVLALLTLAFALFATVVASRAEGRARRAGIFDERSGY